MTFKTQIRVSGINNYALYFWNYGLQIWVPIKCTTLTQSIRSFRDKHKYYHTHSVTLEEDTQS
jgi:hypothetical protein